MPKKRCVILDVDGTLANHDGIRKHHDYTKVHLDEPHLDIIELANMLWYPTRPWLDFVVVSGRPLACRDATRDWLNKHRIPWHSILMRQDGDYRKDYIVKA